MSKFTAEKYCVLPGAGELRLASTSGHVVIVNEEPRVIPAEFESEALAKGARTETQVAELRAKLAAPAGALNPDENKVSGATSGDSKTPEILDPAKLAAPAKAEQKK